MSKIIDMQINKGGTAKTRSVIEVASRLASGKVESVPAHIAAKGEPVRVLVLDKDTNKLITNLLLGNGAEYDAHAHGLRDILDVYTDPTQLLKNAVVPYTFEVNGQTFSFDLVPGSRLMEQGRARFDETRGSGKKIPVNDFRLVLGYVLHAPEVQARWQVILLDSGPGQNEVMEGCLWASDGVIMPVEPSLPSSFGLSNFGLRVAAANEDRFNADYNAELDGQLIRLLGVLITRFNKDIPLEPGEANLQAATIAEMRRLFRENDIPCFSMDIPERPNAITKALNASLPVWVAAPKDPVSKAYVRFCEEVAPLLF